MHIADIAETTSQTTDGRTDGHAHTDGQHKNTIPPAPSDGGGAKKYVKRQQQAINLKPESTGYSALPSPSRLTQDAVRLGRHTHTHTDRRRATQYLLHSVSSSEGND